MPREERLYLIKYSNGQQCQDLILIDTLFHNSDLENYPQRSQRAEMCTVCCYYVSKVKVGQDVVFVILYTVNIGCPN